MVYNNNLRVYYIGFYKVRVLYYGLILPHWNGRNIYPTPHCDKHCLNATINLIIIVTMIHYITIYSTLHCDITKFGFNVRVYNIQDFNIGFIIYNSDV